MSLKQLRFSSQDKISFKINDIVKTRLVTSLMSRYFKLNIYKGKIKELDLKILAKNLQKIGDVCGPETL